jgi:ABC-type multidrug transport system permease subunit
MKQAALRFLNVLTVLCTLYLAALIYTVVAGGIANWTVFVRDAVIPLGIGYAGILIANYILLGRPTLWNSRH